MYLHCESEQTCRSKPIENVTAEFRVNDTTLLAIARLRFQPSIRKSGFGQQGE